MTTELEPIQQGLWLRGPPGGGRSTVLVDVVARWHGPAVRLRPDAWSEDLAALAGLGGSVLRSIDDAPEGLNRADLGAGPVVATGGRPGVGWIVKEVGGLPTDEGVRLFLRHAPGARPVELVRQLVRTLGGHPTAVVAAARRWPLERLQSILLDPSPGWDGLRDAWDALSEANRRTLGLMCALGGTAVRAGLIAASAEEGLPGLVASGWVGVREPGVYRVSGALAQAVAPWQSEDPTPYQAWILGEAQRRAEAWDRLGGARSWFAYADWPTLQGLPGSDQAWFYEAWSLSDVAPEALINALDSAEMPPVSRARCHARALLCLGRRAEALTVLDSVPKTIADANAAMAWVERGVVHQRMRQLDQALAAYETAETALRGLAHARGLMLCEANRAAVCHDKGELEAAAQGYGRALQVASTLGEDRLRAIFGGNLGALFLEQGDSDQARATLADALRALSRESDPRFLAVIHVNLGNVDLVEGLLDAADTHYVRALSAFAETDPASEALCHARRGAVAAQRDDLEQARAHHELADALAQPLQAPHATREMALWRAILEWKAGDRAAALRRRTEAITGSPSLADVSDEARLVLRLLESMMSDATQVLTVGPSGQWFRLPDGPRVDIARYAACCRILAFLASWAERKPGHLSDADALIEAGWPGERIVPAAARNRLSVALVQLRKQGLREVMQRSAAGWRLDPEWPTVLLRANDD
ncbi:MAG: tetratricopeptide repeat protein [Myxococcota bacterium]